MNDLTKELIDRVSEDERNYKREQAEKVFNRENWDSFRNYKFLEPVGNETVQNMAAGLRFFDPRGAERIANDPRFEVPNDPMSRALSWGTDTATALKMLGLGAAVVGSSVPRMTAGLGSLEKMTEYVASHPKTMKTLGDISINDVMKTNRMANVGEENNTHIWDALTGYLASKGVSKMAKNNQTVEDTTNRFAGKMGTKAVVGAGKKGIASLLDEPPTDDYIMGRSKKIDWDTIDTITDAVAKKMKRDQKEHVESMD